MIRLRTLARTAAGLGLAAVLNGQVCRLSVAGLNQSRRVRGPVHAECPDEIVHTAPFGNWGVTSNHGQKGDSHQFQGWCRDAWTCNNSGACQLRCTAGFYEWNSCTGHALYSPPNCTLYNAANCTEQVTSTGVNVHGTRTVEVPVRCPSAAAEGSWQGGCSDVRAYASGTNFMSLYELDPATPDDLVQTLYFPETTVALACDVWGCAPQASAWVTPSAYDSPKSPVLVFAELATAVNWGAFADDSGVCNVAKPEFAYVSAASFLGPSLAPGSIASAFGPGLSPVTEAAQSTPLPMSLAGVSLRIADSLRRVHNVPLFFVSPGQANFLVPEGVATGPATVAVYRGPVQMAASAAQISTVAPAVFSANSDGRGVAAAIAVHVQPGGAQRWHHVFTDSAPVGSRTSVPIDLGPAGETVYLVLFGTGIRGRTELAAVQATVGGVPAVVEYAGAQGSFEGLDQVNLRLPPKSAIPRGEIDLILTVDGQSANRVTVSIKADP
ncbi:MAG TPA: hypothetical protein VLH09_14945 [Bryobacteraceae bacterium]|nr:hypothetical protein [Bryobacteraceae bacterium]